MNKKLAEFGERLTHDISLNDGLKVVGFAIACGTWMIVTKGNSGIGWFLFFMIFFI